MPRRRRPASPSLLAPAAGLDRLPTPPAAALAPHLGALFSPSFFSQVLASAKTPYRRRLLSIEVVVLGLVHLLLSRLASLLDLVDRLASGRVPGLAQVEVSPQAFYQRLRALPHALFLALLQQTSRALRAPRAHSRAFVSALAPFASGIYALDETTLDALLRKSRVLRELA